MSERFLLRNSRVIIDRSSFSWLGIHGGAARKRRCGHHADLMHNILNSLRGEAVPEDGVMHGSAIQVSRRITSARRHVYGSTIRVLSTLVRSRSTRRYRLGRWKDLPAPSISDYRHGTASPPKNNFGTPFATGAFELPTLSASHLFLCR